MSVLATIGFEFDNNAVYWVGATQNTINDPLHWTPNNYQGKWDLSAKGLLFLSFFTNIIEFIGDSYQSIGDPVELNSASLELI